MFIIPAIDLKDGKVVRLTQGDFKRLEEFAVKPIEAAIKFAKAGAKWIHVVDLYAALGEKRTPEQKVKNLGVLKEIVREVAKFNVKVQFGGGIRSPGYIENLLDTKVSRLILGTLPQESIHSLRAIIKKYGDKIAISLDAKNSILYKQGWTESSKIEMKTFLQDLKNCGVKLLIYTNIAKDGMLKGPDFEGIKNILSLTDIPIIASGGVSSLDDIKKLKQLEPRGLCGIIIGKAIYKQTIDLAEAIRYVD